MENAAEIRNHWWARPGWRPGRIMLMWQVTFENAPELSNRISAYQRALAPLAGLNPVPPKWLHLTVQNVGYVDDTPPATTAAAIDAVRNEVVKLHGFDVALHRPMILGEAIAIPAQPAEPLEQLRDAVRAGIATARGADAVPTNPEHTHGYRPHVSIAYCRIDANAAPYAAALTAIDCPPVVVPITNVTLVRQDRQLAPHWLYRWTTEATAALPN